MTMILKVTEAKSHPVDRHVGRRVAERRLSLGHSQSDLARAIGLTFQQVQKYEKGTNRISASKLWEISRFLGCDVAAFYAGLSDEDGGMLDDELQNRPATRTGLEIEKWARRLSPPRQKLVRDLVQILAGDPL